MPNILRGAKLLDLGRKSAAGLFFAQSRGEGLAPCAVVFLNLGRMDFWGEWCYVTGYSLVRKAQGTENGLFK